MVIQRNEKQTMFRILNLSVAIGLFCFLQWAVESTKMCRLRNGCRFYVEKYDQTFLTSQKSYILCDLKKNQQAELVSNLTNISLNSQCGKKFQKESKYIYEDINLIFENGRYEHSWLTLMLFEMMQATRSIENIEMFFSKIRDGFNVKSPIKFPNYSDLKIENFYFENSLFNLIDDNGRRVRTCEEFDQVFNSSFTHIVSVKRRQNLIQLKILGLTYTNMKFGAEPVCERFFRNMGIMILKISGLIDSFYKTNLLRFEKHKSQSVELNSTIHFLYVETYDIDLDSRLLNPRIFSKLGTLTILKQPRTIRADDLKLLKKLKSIQIETYLFVSFLSRQGLDWIAALNQDVSVDLNNDTDIIENFHKAAYVSFTDIVRFQLDKDFELLQNEDFCLINDFPFRQMIIINMFEDHLNKTKSCTALWLFINSKRLYPPDNYYNSIYVSNPLLDKCDFEKRIQLCNKTKFR